MTVPILSESRSPESPDDSRTFPVMHHAHEAFGPAITSIPWSLIEPHEAQALRNHGGQTLHRLACRGGLCYCEIVAVLEDRDWRAMPPGEALARLREIVERKHA